MKINYKSFLIKILFLSLILNLNIEFSSLSISENINPNERINLSITDTNSSGIRGNYKKIILITWDGTRTRWINEYSANGELPTIQQMRQKGGVTYLGLGNTHSSTDCCLATIETGVGPLENKIIANQFGAGTPKLRIPDGMQTSERLKAFFGDEFKTGHLNSWQHHSMDENIFGLPKGHISQGMMFDPIFLNAEPGIDVDFWFGSENLSWIPEDVDTHKASWDEYWYGKWEDETPYEGLLPPHYSENSTSYGYVSRQNLNYWKSPLINANYLAEKTVEFIELYANNDFYVRIHMTEPDKIGHSYSESSDDRSFNTITPEYLLALKECDKATGKIMQALIEKGIDNDTLVIVGADHSFLGGSHSEESLFYTGNQKVWGYFGENKSETQGIIHNIQPTILSLAGIENWTENEYYKPKILYDEELVSYYSPLPQESTSESLITTTDESGDSEFSTTNRTSFSSIHFLTISFICIGYKLKNKKKK